MGEATSVNWYYLLGGALGAAYVFAALSLVPTIGAGGVAAATVTGQLTLSVLLDKVGFLGLEELRVEIEPAGEAHPVERVRRGVHRFELRRHAPLLSPHSELVEASGGKLQWPDRSIVVTF